MNIVTRENVIVPDLSLYSDRPLLNVWILQEGIVDSTKATKLKVLIVDNCWCWQWVNSKAESGELAHTHGVIYQIQYCLINRRICLLFRKQSQVLKDLVEKDSVSSSNYRLTAAVHIPREPEARLEFFVARGCAP